MTYVYECMLQLLRGRNSLDHRESARNWLTGNRPLNQSVWTEGTRPPREESKAMIQARLRTITRSIFSPGVPISKNWSPEGQIALELCAEIVAQMAAIEYFVPTSLKYLLIFG